jgi:lysophospholipase L1-like esterase
VIRRVVQEVNNDLGLLIASQQTQGISVKLLVSLVLPLVVLLMMESCSRTVVTLYRELAVKPVAESKEAVPSRDLGWERAPNFEGRLGFDFDDHLRKHDAQGFLAYDTAQIQDSTRPRIIALGDSNTYGWGVAPEAAWVEVLDRELPAAHVINLAWLGYSSFHGYKTLLKYGDQLQPALILASFNFNDRRYVYDERIDSEEKFARNFEAIQKRGTYDWLDKIHTVTLMRALMRRAGLIRPEPLPTDPDARTLQARVPPDKYRENLQKIAQYGKERNIPVIFLLLKDNPYYTEHIRRGLEFRQAGDYERALRSFSLGLTNQISGTLSRKYLALTYEDMGALEKAKYAARVERQLEPIDGLHVIHLDSEYNKIMLEVGKEFGIKVVDPRAMLDAHPEQFIDLCHPDEVGHARIAGLMLQAVKEVAPALARDAVDMSEKVAQSDTRR